MIALASDHAGYPLKEEIKKLLDGMQEAYIDFGTDSLDSCDYAVYAHRAGLAMQDGRCDKAIMICGTGAGIGMAASKMKGTRVCTCSDTYTVEYSRRHNDCNVLTFGARVVGPGLAEELVKIFLTTPFEGGRHQRRINQIAMIERGESPEQ